MKIEAGFTYTVERVCKRTGEVLDCEVIENLMPELGRNHMLNVVLNGVAPVTQWYVLLYGNDYTPKESDSAATFPGLAGELTNYDGSSRVLFDPANAVMGVVSNEANRAEFSFLGDATVRGGAIVSASGKGATSGVLLSAAKFAAPKPADADTILRIRAGIELTNAS